MLKVHEAISWAATDKPRVSRQNPSFGPVTQSVWDQLHCFPED